LIFAAVALALAAAAGVRGGEPSRCTPAPLQAPIGPFWQMDLRVLDFGRFDVDLPGRGVRPVWYLRYELTNRTDKPHQVSPLLTLTAGGKSVPDEVLPAAEAAFHKRIAMDGKPAPGNSIGLAKNAIAPGQSVQAVAFWDGAPVGGPATIKVRGLSNGVFEMGKTTYIKTLYVVPNGSGSAHWVYVAR
jgi:hypothetical protein